MCIRDSFRGDSDAIQHLAMFEQLRKERHKLVDLQNQYNDTVALKTSSPAFYILIAVYVASVGGAIAFALIKFLLKTRTPTVIRTPGRLATAPTQQDMGEELFE